MDDKLKRALGPHLEGDSVGILTALRDIRASLEVVALSINEPHKTVILSNLGRLHVLGELYVEFLERLKASKASPKPADKSAN